MKKIVITFLVVIGLVGIISCITLTEVKSDQTQKRLKFPPNSCAKFDIKKLKPGQYSEGIVFYIRDVGQIYYFVDFFHKRVGWTKKLFKKEVFDKNFIKVKCNKVY